jgi:predicted secreted hydrolase
MKWCSVMRNHPILDIVAVLGLILVLLSCSDRGARDSSSLPLTGLRVSDVLAGGSDAGYDSGYKKASHVIAFEFPKDHGKHPGFRSEWWYLTSTLRTNRGRLFGVQYTLFRQAYAPQVAGASQWQNGQMYLAHFAVTDVSGALHRADQRFARQHKANADVEIGPHFLAKIDDWRLEQITDPEGISSEHGWRMQLNAQGVADGQNFGVSLELAIDTPPRLQGETGLSRKGIDQASYYYSLPRIPTKGALTIDGENFQVAGLTWMDREWSTSVLADGVVGWAWLSLHLNDGRDLMVFRLRRSDGQRDVFDHGLLVDENETKSLAHSDFEMRPVRFWQDPEGASWPVEWQVVLATGESLTVSAALDDQLMEVGLVYWEGLVQVKDAQQNLLGEGYLELTGYRR